MRGCPCKLSKAFDSWCMKTIVSDFECSIYPSTGTAEIIHFPPFIQKAIASCIRSRHHLNETADFEIRRISTLYFRD